MSAAPIPYFYDEALRHRFGEDIDEAVDAFRITRATGEWLRALVDDTQSTEIPPRVDRLLIADRMPVSAGLASAFVISDSDRPIGPVYLSTVMFGIERFDTRESLLAALHGRFPEVAASGREIELEHVEENPFDQRMQMILAHQAAHLDRLGQNLHQMPTLQMAVGQALQTEVDKFDAQPPVDVFTHLVQIVNPRRSASIESIAPVLKTQTLAETAYQLHVGQVLEEGLGWQFLDRHGAVLDEVRSGRYLQALRDAGSQVSATYEQSLSRYWTSPCDSWRTMRQAGADALAESFGQKLLSIRAGDEMGRVAYARMRQLLSQAGADETVEGLGVESVWVSVDGDPAIRLPGLILLESASPGVPDLYLFSSVHGFGRIKDRRRLTEYLMDERTRHVLLAHASVVERERLIAQAGTLTLAFQSVSEPVFEMLIRDVIDLQKRNLLYALALPGIGYDQAPVRIDDALDIRALLDHRLLSVGGSWRWRDEGADFQQLWGSPEIGPRRPNDDMRLLFETWASQVDKLERMVNRVADLHQGAETFICHELNRYLAVAGERGHDARTLLIGGANGDLMIRLPSYVLEAVTGAAGQAIPDDWIVQRELGERRLDVSGLPVRLLDQIVRWVVKDFPARYAGQLRSFSTTPRRHADFQTHPAAISQQVREEALRLELTICQRLKTVSAFASEMIEQVLDRPLAVLQQASAKGRVECHTVALSFSGRQPAVALSNAFVLSFPDQPGRHVMWAARLGIGDFNSLRELEDELTSRLTKVDRSESLFALMSDADRQRLDHYLERTNSPAIRLVLNGIDGHLIHALQAGEMERQILSALDACKDAAAWHLKSYDFTNMLYVCNRDDVNRGILAALRGAIRAVVSMTVVPEWLAKASDYDQDLFLAAMQRFYVSCGLNESFLFNIPMLQHYSRRRVSEQLAVDFPDLQLDPDVIEITLTRYVPAPVAPGSAPVAVPAASDSVTESLSDFAYNRFYATQQGTLSIAMADGSAPDSRLTPTYVHQLVGRLDIAQEYLMLLGKTFDADDQDYGKRRRLFAEQLPALDMLRALNSRLEGTISKDAYRLIGSILEMPDALARLTINGQYATISPLRLKPGESGWEPAAVLGTYVIAPRDQSTGPWVLYSLIGDFVFREYPDKAALLREIHTSATLQAYLLERIDEDARQIYDHGGFQEPHLPFSTESSFDVPLFPPRPVVIEIAPYEGNALELLFKDMLACYLWSVRKVVVTSEQAQRSASRYLFELGVEQTLAFLPGRLGALVGIWQSGSLFDASARAAGERQWGKAFSELTAAVGTLVSTRHAALQEASFQTEETGEALEVADNFQDPEDSSDSLAQEDDLAFTWRNGGLTPELRNRLRAFEVHDVALNQLRRNELINTYSDSEGHVYVAISGSVYRIRQEQGDWFIINRDRRGPAVRLSDNQKWELDFGGLKGGGGHVSRLNASMIDLDVDDLLIIEARGMAQIRLQSPAHAVAIEQGHAQARSYLENCMDNLTENPSTQTIHPKAQRLIDDFFAQHIPDTALYASVRQAVVRLYRGLMHPSLSPQNSQRFVTGINRRWHEPTSAFTFVQDPQERIFLTERFFRVPMYRLKTRVVKLASFNIEAHHYAAILIHELTHLVLGTDDIAYVESTVPYIDLLEDTTAQRLRQKNEIKEHQRHVLSYDTDRSKLFKQAEDGIWRDLRRRDGDAKQTILRLTGTRTLEQARDMFYANQAKRAAVMMSNADSVALLLTLLGRERFNPRP